MIPEKRTYDTATFDFNCSALLAQGETITGVNAVLSDQSGFTFGTPLVNLSAITYPDNTFADVGKVVQVQIGGGSIPAGRTDLLCTMRCRFSTNLNPALEATALLRLNDTVRG